MSALEDGLDQLARDLDAFIQLLKEESQALGQGDAGGLPPLIVRRNEANTRLAERWQRLATALGMPARAGLAALMERAHPDGRVAPAWRLLEARAKEADHLNRLNGRLLDEQMRRTQAAMQVLRNAAASRGLYGADGLVTDLFTSNRRIDIA